MSQTNLGELLAPHFQAIGETPLTAGTSVVSVTTAGGTNITSTTRYTGGEVASQWTYNDGAVTESSFGVDANNALLAIADSLTAAIKATHDKGSN